MVGRETATIEVAGTLVLTPVVAVLAMHLALHAAASAHRVPKTLMELEQGVATIPRQVWQEALALASELDSLHALAGGLALCPSGARLAEGLGLQPATTDTIRLWRATTEYARPWTIQLLADQPSLRAAGVAVARRCFPPAARVRSVGGRPGWFWLGLGYGVRLGGIALRIPGSLVAWVRFTRRKPSERSAESAAADRP